MTRMTLLPPPVSKKLDKLRKLVTDTISDLYEERSPILEKRRMKGLSRAEADRLSEVEGMIDELETLYEDLSGATRERLRFIARLDRLESEMHSRLTKVEAWQESTEKSFTDFLAEVDKVDLKMKPGDP